MRRKKDTGAPGNRGEFATTQRAGSGLDLGTAGAGPVGEKDLEYATQDPRVSIATLNRMLQHDQPVPVRAAAARSCYPGTAETASYDPSPYVRALAAAASDITEPTRRRLSGDPHVQRVLAVLTA